MADWEKLQQCLQGGKRLLIFLHDNPDPDALAAGWLLYRVGEHLKLRCRIIYGGKLGRAENFTMVKQLRIPARQLKGSRTRFLKTDRYAMVDTQPNSGNNAFPHERLRCHVVIDHHSRRPGVEADFIDIRPGEGSCATMVLEYFQAAGLELDGNLSTAVAYAIMSETQDLERETTIADRRALQQILPQVNLRLLGRIRHPVHDREYYRTIARAMRRVEVAKNTCVCHIGEVHQAEVVAELADFLIPMDRVTWCLVTGFHEKSMVLSIRTTHEKARADRVMRHVLRRLGKGGGHNMIAGGRAPCDGLDDYRRKTEQVTDRFLKRLSRRVPENLRPLIEEKPPAAPEVPPDEEQKKSGNGSKKPSGNARKIGDGKKPAPPRPTENKKSAGEKKEPDKKNSTDREPSRQKKSS
jgi:nanoRNase/pAp phosphatase (c-di-AMP/oligoRNAs hydrolase)